MKTTLTFILAFLLSQSVAGQFSFAEWETESQTNKRMLPRYGYLAKTQAEISSDSAFVKEIMSQPQFKTRREASNHLVQLGFQYYYRRDLKTAMYRFNQAYLLDTSNTDIFWGYGAVYMALGQFELAKSQYQTGLALEPGNTHLLTDLATYFMQQFYMIQQMPANNEVKNPAEQAKVFMDSALLYLNRSYKLDSSDVNTAYKLSICYWNIEDCANAWKYYDACMALGGRPVTKEYTRDLNNRCRRN